MRKVKGNLQILFVCVVITFACLFGYLMLQNLCVELFVQWGWEVRVTENSLLEQNFWLAFLVTGIIVPVCEELFFRFAVCSSLKLTKIPDWTIILISAVIFMLFHGSWSQTIYQLLMGIWFAWIYLKTRKIGWTVLMHVINNTFIVAYTSIVGNGSNVFELSVWNVILSVSLAVVTTILVTFLIKKGIPQYEK